MGVAEKEFPKQRRKRNTKKAPALIDTTLTAEGQEVVPKPKRSRKRKAVDSYEATVVIANDVEISTDPVTRPRRRKAATKAAAAIKTTAEENTVVEKEDVDAEEPPRKRRRRRKTPEEDRIYEIDPIPETLPTTFKGRLGYACLNTILRARDPPIFCSRTCRIATLKAYDEATDDDGNLLNELFVPDGINPHPVIRKLALQNVTDLATLIRWNAENTIHFMRISSDMFPFASHSVHGYTLAFADEELKEAGRVAKEVGCRLTSHPGQFTQLGSLRENVVEAAAKDLQCEFFARWDER